jgi:hypothetical protein
MSIIIPLKDKWTLWYHAQDNENWDESSYKNIYEFSDLVSYFKFQNSFIYLPQFLNGYYFLMRNDIMPIWEDSKNREGGCYSIRVNKDLVDQFFWDFFTHILCDSFLQKDNDTINGISVVPKKFNAIIKIWNNNSKVNSISLFHKHYRDYFINDISYRPHLDNLNYGKNYS